MEINYAELNASCFHRAWEDIQIREAILMAIREAELNAACLQQAETEANSIMELSYTGRAIFNEQNATNQLHYKHNQGPRDKNESFAHYMSDFTDDLKIPFENHTFVQAQQQKFRNEIAKFEMRYFYICQERLTTKKNLHMVGKILPTKLV